MEETGKYIQYLAFNKYLTITLEASSVQVIKWFVDASFAVYRNTGIHTRGFMTLRKSCVYGNSFRQNFNTKILKEAELVEVSIYGPGISWSLRATKLRNL